MCWLLLGKYNCLPSHYGLMRESARYSSPFPGDGILDGFWKPKTRSCNIHICNDLRLYQRHVLRARPANVRPVLADFRPS